MSSIILDLKESALNPAIGVPDLLRKAMIASKALGVEQFESWIQGELNGYTEVKEIPDYRVVKGEVKVFNPLLGYWQPVEFENHDIGEEVSRRAIGQSISEIESLVRNRSEYGVLQIPFPIALQKQMMDATGAPTPPTLIGQYSGLIGILDKVRTIVLDWALKLESEGIQGDGLSFTDQEKTTAQDVTINFTYINGSVSSSPILQAGPGAIQTIAFSNIQHEEIAGILQSLKESIDQFGLESRQEADIKADIKSIEAQLASSQPKSSVLRDCLHSILNTLLTLSLEPVAADLINRIKPFLGIS